MCYLATVFYKEKPLIKRVTSGNLQFRKLGEKEVIPTTNEARYLYERACAGRPAVNAASACVVWVSALV